MHDVRPIFFDVIPRLAIWGGTKARAYFGYDVPDGTGQVWAFAAQPDGDTACSRGGYAGKTLGELFEEKPELFASRYERFPFIISLVTPEDDLSVQVHPTDGVARELGFTQGKNEAWVMLESDEGSSLVYGLNGSVDEAIPRIEAGEMKGLFKSVPTSAGEFFYIPAGTVHALGRGNVAYEVQQSTDVTFRIYDYGRTDAEGNSRPLDTQRAVATVLSAPKIINETLDFVHPEAKSETADFSTVTEYIANDAFCITSIEVHGSIDISPNSYCLCTVSKGKGSVNGEEVRFADNFLLPVAHEEVKLRGFFTLMITSESSLLASNSSK